ncbi:MAG: hypothetical protein V7K38_04610 [Nostoc sp.]|uniref:hypothetical protein n=1 Tax=Nostoc sp. TaxID=1180 RepID=UPI002FF99B80
MSRFEKIIYSVLGTSLIVVTLISLIQAIATEALARIEDDKSLSERVLSALKAGGVSAFEQLLNHPSASFVIGALEDWQKTKGA